MKNTIFFIPAIVFIIFYAVVAGLVFGSPSPIVSVWNALFVISGTLLSKRIFWGGFPGMLPGIHMMYMSTIDTGQIMDIELPAGLAIVIFYLICSGIVFLRNRNVSHRKNSNEM